MSRTPGPHPLHRGGALEVPAVAVLGEPSPLGLAFAFRTARPLAAEELMAQVAPVRQKDAFAVHTLPRIGQRRHRAPKKIQPPPQTNTPQLPPLPSHPKKTREERRRHLSKGSKKTDQENCTVFTPSFLPGFHPALRTAFRSARTLLRRWQWRLSKKEARATSSPRTSRAS